MAKDQWWHLPKGEYKRQFLIALSMAAHTDCLDPAELQYWFDKSWTQDEMTREMFNRVKAMR